jgi:pyruvate dehydrogenase E1 component beta subunit
VHLCTQMRLLASGVLDEETAARIDVDADKAVAAAVDFADASPAPDVATLFDHVYATPVPSVYRARPGDPIAAPPAKAPPAKDNRHDGAQPPAGPARHAPRRVRDTPICEEGFTGVAIGAAMMGLRPVVEIMTINFSLLAIDQIVNNAAKLRSLSGGQVSVPLVIRTPGGGGQQLSATHLQNLEIWYAHVPGLKVVAPATPADAKGLLAAAIRDDDPVLVLENLALYNTKGDVPDGEYLAEIGRAAVVKPGRDVTIVGYSRAAVIALDVARRLESDGISAEDVDLRSLRPLDRDTVCASVRKTSRAVIVEDDWLSYGTGAELAATIQEGAFDYLDAPVRRVAAAEVPLPYAKPLELAALPDAAAITRVIRKTLGGN